MTSLSRRLASTLLPVSLLLVAMASVQGGASLAKSLFPVIGAQGTTTLRLVFAAIILALLLRPWQARISRASLKPLILYGLALGGMNLMFYMSLRTIPLGIAVTIEFIGPLTLAVVLSRRLSDLLWVTLAAVGILLLGVQPGDVRGERRIIQAPGSDTDRIRPHVPGGDSVCPSSSGVLQRDRGGKHEIATPSLAQGVRRTSRI